MVTKFSIEGMHCGACVRRVTLALQKLHELEIQHVEIGSASVRTAEAADPAPEVIAALEAAGFTGRAEGTQGQA